MKFLFFSLLFISTLFAQALDVKNLTENRLSASMSYIKLGNSKSVDPHQLLNSPTFKKINNSNLGQHFEDAIWTKVKLTNSSNQPIKVFLLNTIPLTQTLDLFVFEQYGVYAKYHHGIFKFLCYRQ